MTNRPLGPAVPFLVGSIAYLAVRCVWLSQTSIDPDELFSVLLIRNSFQGVWTAAAADVSHPPLFFLVLKLWAACGDGSLDWLRVLPLVLTAVAVPAVWAVARLSGLGLWYAGGVLLFLAGNVYLVNYTVYLRSFVALFVAGAYQMWALLRVCRGRRPAAGAWVALWLTSTAAVYSHYWGWLLLLGEFVAVALFARRRLAGVAVVGLATVVAYLPWVASLAFALQSRSGDAVSQIAWIERPTLKSIPYFYALLNGVPPVRYLGTAAVAMVFAVVAVALGRAARRPRVPRHALVLGLAVVVLAQPLVTWAACFVQSQSVWATRSMVSVAVPFAVLVFLSVRTLPLSRPVRGRLAVAVALWGLGCGVATVARPPVKVNITELARRIRAADAGRSNPIPIYMTPFQAAVLDYLGNDGTEPRLEIHPSQSLDELPRGRFWVVISSHQWRGEPIEDHLRRSNLSVLDRFEIRTDPEVISGYFVESRE